MIFLHGNCYFTAFNFGKDNRHVISVRNLYVFIITISKTFHLATLVSHTSSRLQTHSLLHPHFPVFILPSAFHRGHWSITIQHSESSTNMRDCKLQVKMPYNVCLWITLCWIFHNPVAILQRKACGFTELGLSAEFEQRPGAKALESFNLNFISYCEAAPGRSFNLHISPYFLTHCEISNT